MIPFRYHVISLAAVLLALASGVLLGSGLLHKDVSATTTAGGQRAVSPTLAGYDAGYAAVTGPELVKGTLSGHRVLIATIPGARESEVDGLIENLGRSGAKISGRVVLTDKLLSSGNRQFAEGVAEQAHPDGKSTTNPWDTIGTAFARGWLTTKDAKLDDTARTVRAAFTEGGLVSTVQEPSNRSDLLVIVSGPSATAHGQVLTELLGSVTAGARGVLVAGPIGAGEGGVVQDVRDSESASQLSTFDVLDMASGRVGAVLALAKAAEGQPGSWGTSRGADGPLPR